MQHKPLQVFLQGCPSIAHLESSTVAAVAMLRGTHLNALNPSVSAIRRQRRYLTSRANLIDGAPEASCVRKTPVPSSCLLYFSIHWGSVWFSGVI